LAHDFFKNGEIRMINIGIVGGGRGGASLLEVFLANGEVNVVGITDINTSAPGLELARRKGIFVAGSIEELSARNPHIVINATGDSGVSQYIIQ
jgi:methyl-accepting chemotaxis protein